MLTLPKLFTKSNITTKVNKHVVSMKVRNQKVKSRAINTVKRNYDVTDTNAI